MRFNKILGSAGVGGISNIFPYTPDQKRLSIIGYTPIERRPPTKGWLQGARLLA